MVFVDGQTDGQTVLVCFIFGGKCNMQPLWLLKVVFEKFDLLKNMFISDHFHL